MDELLNEEGIPQDDTNTIPESAPTYTNVDNNLPGNEQQESQVEVVTIDYTETLNKIILNQESIIQENIKMNEQFIIINDLLICLCILVSMRFLYDWLKKIFN
ncbi:MAG: hypothetical protein RR945_10185 [Erysipelotrichaceae bacterium]|uniref:hypothetical protein n=1 Tax=Anaerorhabdus sp. TaxID=1872524 RepID=UPI002FC88010